MTKPSFDFHALCQRHAAKCACPNLDPSNYPCSAEIKGLTLAALGPDRCSRIYHRLRRLADAKTAGDFALSVARDATTHERLGYLVHTRDQVVADEVAHAIQGLVR